MKHKIKWMKRETGISDDEIRQFMGFDQLLEKRALHMKSLRVKRTIGSALVILIGLISYLISVQQVDTPDSATTEHEQTIPGKKNFLPEKESITNADSIVNSEETQPVAKANKQKVTAPKPTHEPAREEKVNDVYIQAEPVHGYNDLYQYFNENLVYPSEAIKDSVEGVMMVSFVVNINGKPEQIRTNNSLGALFENESIRLVEAMPDWNPATLNGKPVPSKINIPVTFHLKRIK